MLKKNFIVAIIILITVLYFFPIYWMISSSLKHSSEFRSYPPTFIPRQLTLENIKTAINDGVIKNIANSLIIAISSTIIVILASSLAGYAIARMHSKLVTIILLFFLISQMLPQIVVATPLYLFFNDLGLLNTYLSVILANATFAIPFATIILRTTFLQIPMELEEAARIDGCNKFQSFLKITWPLSSSGLTIVGVISFVWGYGDFIFASTFLQNQEKYPATVGLYNYLSAQIQDWSKVMAFSTLAIIPIVILFIFLQKYIVQGMTAGAIK